MATMVNVVNVVNVACVIRVVSTICMRVYSPTAMLAISALRICAAP